MILSVFKRLLFTLLFCAVPALAQNARYDNVAFTSAGLNAAFIANATITVCTFGGSGLPCTPKVTGLCLSASDVSCTQPNPTTSDALGNYGFWIQPGKYVVTVTKAGLGGYSTTLTLPCDPTAACTVTGALNATGTTTLSNSNKTLHCETFAGATADVQIAACIAALPSGGIADATGYGATTQSLAAQVTIPSNITLLFDPNTKFQASTAALNPFLVKTNSRTKGFHFDCGNQPTYSGTLFTLTDLYTDGNNTQVDDVNITCSGVTTGTGALLSSSSTSQFVVWVRFSHWRQFGLQQQVLFTASGNGFVNSNQLSDMQMTRGGTASTQLHYTPNGGQVNANKCMGCDFEAQSVNTNSGVIIDGTTGANDLVSNNQYYGNIWDTNVPVQVLNSKAAGNLFAGGIFGTPTDTTNANIYIVTSGNFSWGPNPIISLAAGSTFQDNFIATATPSTGSKTLHLQNTGGNAYFAIENSAGTTFGIPAYSTTIHSPNNDVIATTPNFHTKTFLADRGNVCTNGELALSAGWQSTGAATVTAVAGTGQTCSWTITTGTTTAANPTVTDTLTNALPSALTVCELNIHGGTHTAAAGEGFQQTTLSATAPVFTFNGTPTAGGTTYFVTRRCGP